jgi:nucleotide-binding universal stress UspA family protein
MIAIRHILCPIDFSESARRAFDQAVAIARWSGARVTVLHVASPAAVTAAAPDAHLVTPGGPMPADRDRLLVEVRRFIEAPSVAGGVVDVLLREGPPAGEILDQVTALRPDLLVMGTHGRSGLQRLLLGSVAEHVLHAATCPVLTVPPRQPDAVPATSSLYATILCPVDFSDTSADAVRFAVSLAEGSGGRLTIVHVLSHDLQSTPDMYDTMLSDSRLSDEAYQQRRAGYARQRVLELVPEAAGVECLVETVGPDGPPAKEILRLAAAQQSDLIVMGVQPRTDADLLISGSTTHEVVREAGCAVLTLRGTAMAG